jgi:hypothetical protein
MSHANAVIRASSCACSEPQCIPVTASDNAAHGDGGEERSYMSGHRQANEENVVPYGYSKVLQRHALTGTHDG